MGIKKKLIFGFSGITFLTIIIGCTLLIRLYKIADLINREMPEVINAANKTSHLDGLAQFIRYYDEVLTQSARNYAFTQNKKWERRYRDVEPKLDSTIKEAVKKGGEKDRYFFNSINKTNLALNEMEYRAIELTNNGQAGKAVQLLESSEYWEQKKIYEQGLRNYVQEKGFGDDQVHETFIQKIELLNIKTQNLIQSSKLVASVFIVISFAMSVIVGCVIFRSISNPLTKLRNAAAEIGKGRLDTEIDISSKDEIGQLAASSGIMTQGLSKTTTSIDNLDEILYRKQKNLEAIFDAAPFGMMLVSDNLRVDRVNDAIRQLTHKDYLQMLNQPIGDVLGCVHSFHSEKGCGHSPSCESCLMLQSVANVFNSECSVHDLEIQLVLKINNEEISPWFRISIVLTKIGDQKYALITFNDITRHKQADEALRHAYKELEDTNKELKDVHSQMVQSEKLASIGQLAAGVAHEMNTPVGFVASNFQTLQNYVKKIQDMFLMYEDIIKNAETLEKESLLNKADIISKAREDMQIDFIMEDIDELFSDSEEGLARVTDIVQNLRDFSRIDQSGDFAEYDVNDGIKSTLVVARNELKYDCDIITKFSEVPFILCQSGQINQVFLSILINAAQAIKSQQRKQKGTITITTYADNDKVICEISDDGPGIPPDKLTKIFDPFFTTKPTGEGTGLGLSVSYDIIVNKHKGELLVDSNIGEGTKFTIKLSIRDEEFNKERGMTSDEKEKRTIRG